MGLNRAFSSVLSNTSSYFCRERVGPSLLTWNIEAKLGTLTLSPKYRRFTLFPAYYDLIAFVLLIFKYVSTILMS